MQYNLEISDPADDPTVGLIRDNLVSYNLMRMGRHPASGRFAIAARGPTGALVGGLVAGIDWDWLYIELLWVDAAQRGLGVGTALMNGAEEQAVKAGITRAHTTTASFQARPFYERRGYTVFGTLEGKPQNHTLFFLKHEALPSQTSTA